MSKIIKLEDGQLVAEDPDNGERVPVSFEALEAETVSTEEAVIESDDEDENILGSTVVDGSLEVTGDLIGHDQAIINSSEYESLNDAISAADDGDIVQITNTQTEPAVVDKSVMLLGRRDTEHIDVDDDNEPALKITEGSVTAINIRVQNSGDAPGLEIDGVFAFVSHSRLRGDVLFTDGARECGLFGNFFQGSDLTIEGDDNVVFGNTRVGTVEDNGDGNEVGFNT